ncbi:MAG: hypothetical protein H0U97_22235 [Gammaproteobacteria bacterium]|nr:hypothetical protein [Gammaproteobacteria bacterium]
MTPQPATSRVHAEHKVYPYLLRGLVIDRLDQVGAADSTYLPLQRGFLYLVAILDWSSRRVLAWRLSNSLTTDFCVAALREAILCYPNFRNWPFQTVDFTCSACLTH